MAGRRSSRVVTVERAGLALAALLSASAARAEAPYVVIALDGIPFEAAERAHAKGLFAGFHAPGRLISPFPSMTTVSFCDILRPIGVEPPRGYELRYFDRKVHRLRGGGLFDYDDEPAPWKGAFQYNQNSLFFKTLVYFSPTLATRYELGRLATELEDLDAPLFMAYVGATDPLAHTGGTEATIDLMERLDRKLASVQAVRARAGREPLRVLILSDHGCQFTGPGYHRMDGVDPEEATDAMGIDLASDLSSIQAVAYPIFGLVGFSALYLSEDFAGEDLRRLVQSLSTMKGVDLVLYEDAGSVRVMGRDAEAVVRHDPSGDAYQYQPIRGDPLRLAPIMEAMRRDGVLDGVGFASDADWLRATALHDYPDALRRVVQAFRDQVANPASVLISYADDYCSERNLAWAGLAVTLKDLDGTHGNLGAPSTYGLVMSNFADPGAYLRGSDVLPKLLPAEILQAAASRRQ